jgi:sulfonate transport system substrate-binding protein
VPYIITGNGGFLRQYPEVATRLLAQDIALAAWVDANPEETIRIFVEETGNAEKSVRATYKDNVFYQNPEITDAAVQALKGEEEFMAANDLIKGEVDYDTWIDRSFYEAAAKEPAATASTN